MYQSIEIDRNNLTLMGVAFPDVTTLDNTANAIGTNMYEGFVPTVGTITLIRDYVLNKISFAQFVEAAKTITNGRL